jgi:hypothetical protein
MSKKETEEKEKARGTLLEMVKPGDTIYTVLRHVSRSGMQRSISLFTNGEEGPFDITYFAARVLGGRVDQKNGGIKVGGCGMDMGFHIVYNLSYCLFPEGFKVEGIGRNGDTSGWDTDGGYALKHRWL